MAKISKEFFTNNEVLFIGYSAEGSKNNPFSKIVYGAFLKNGIKVYPVNNKVNAKYDIKVYNSFSELPKVPKCAYVLTNKGNAEKVIKQLSDAGVKKVLFQNKRNVDQNMLDQCKNYGMEAAVACPMMILGSGIHKFHGFISGVR